MLNANKELELWQPEYANFMIECVPAQPYQGSASIINKVLL